MLLSLTPGLEAVVDGVQQTLLLLGLLLSGGFGLDAARCPDPVLATLGLANFGWHRYLRSQRIPSHARRTQLQSVSQPY